jgi:histidyl-tRNA synthetase
MASNLVPLRGMKDLLFNEYRVHKHIESIAFETAKLYGFEGASTPVLESANIFDRTLGNTSDIISKEMYSFADKKGRLVALRPEFTASIMRAVISNSLKQQLPLKLFSCGPLFRYDRPQEGRQRQFHQLNFEFIGAKGPYSDAEIISLAAHVLSRLEILDDVTLELNSLGSAESRTSYQSALVDYFKQHLNVLSLESRDRLEKNPLRILDSKHEEDINICKQAPVISDYYTANDAGYFEQVKNNLDKLGVKYKVNNRLARGLDYYSHTAFEFTTSKLGAQSTVLAGGRYDDLSELMGVGEIPAIGFAAGIERIALMRNYTLNKDRAIYVLPIEEDSFEYSVLLTHQLRAANITAIIEFNGKLNKRMQMAVANDANYVIFIGADEIKNNSCKLKNLDSGNEQVINKSKLVNFIKNIS